jgi:hypothetical protein
VPVLLGSCAGPEVDMVKRKSCHTAKWFLFSRIKQEGMDEFDNRRS